MGLLLAGCAAQPITRGGIVADPAAFRADRDDCLAREGITQAELKRRAGVMATYALVGSIVQPGNIGAWVGPWANDAAGYDPENDMTNHLVASAAARACVEARGYVLPWYGRPLR